MGGGVLSHNRLAGLAPCDPEPAWQQTDAFHSPPCRPTQVTLFALGAWQACGMIAYALLTQLGSQQLRSSYVRLPAVGIVPVSGVLAAAASGALCATWAVWHNAVWSWPLQVLMLSQLQGGGARPYPDFCGAG